MAESRTINKTVSINIVVEDDTIQHRVSNYNCSECVFNSVEPSSGITCDALAEQITGINCVEQKVHFPSITPAMVNLVSSD